MKFSLKITLFAFLTFVSVMVSALEKKSILIIGDSANTGMVAHPDISISSVTTQAFFNFDLESSHSIFRSPFDVRSVFPFIGYYLSPEFFNLKAPLKTPKLLTQRKWREKKGKDKFGSYIEGRLENIGDRFLNTPEYSWGYLLGSKLGIKPSHMYMTSKNGVSVNDTKRQLDRYVEGGRRKLPDYLFMHYVANDLCSEVIFESQDSQQVEQEYYDRYKSELKSSLDKILNELPINPNGSRVFVVSSLNVIKVLTEPSILQKEIPFEQSPISAFFNLENMSPPATLTCLDLRKKEPPANKAGLSVEIFKELKGMCSSVLRTEINSLNPNKWSEETYLRLERIDLIHKAHVRAQKDAVSEIEQLRLSHPDRNRKEKLEFVFIPDTYELDFNGTHIGNECFHPSVHGHEHVARTIYEFLKANNYAL